MSMKQSLHRVLETIEELSDEGRLNSDTYLRLTNSLKNAFEESEKHEFSAMLDLYAQMCGFVPFNVTLPVFGPSNRDTLRAVFRKNADKDAKWWSEVADFYIQILKDRVFEVEHSSMYLADILISSKLIRVPIKKSMMENNYCPMCHFAEDHAWYPVVDNRMNHILRQSTGIVVVCTSCENSKNHAISNKDLLRKARELVLLSELEEDEKLAAAIGMRRSKRLRPC